MLALPPLPPTIRHLSDPEYERLQRFDPGIWANPHKTCLTCQKKGTFLSPQGETECDCLAQWMLYLYLLNAGIYLNYQRLTWGDLADQVLTSTFEVLDDYRTHIQRYTDAGIGLVLLGTQGTGKTLLASLLIKQLLGDGVDGYATQFNTMIDAYAAGWRDKEDREWFTRRVMNAGVLLIDDIGRESKGRENTTNALFDMVVRHRVASDKPTIITTNYTKAEIQSGYSVYAMSLLAESVIFHEVTGPSYREKANRRSVEDVRAGINRAVTLA